ncbi:hypothetical protein GCM10008171_00010 [Methylopila jiangsuensis]|uniref:Uncharacterized protein n=1 Tax=Methylopila jiangsuensis TaxID=586230 RepID=A0A9W6JFF4_9HYPH|nr:hypothetical protein [Methylopila jiangsuensis]MDR6287493.1 hypothetical protein [Methylopila jiangsuensis]GLK74749.1 hypothetical protein GCM10008171_00010 [Methylopila jiangsuensis]
MTKGDWTVYVDDNFHYMDKEERYRLGSFDSLEAAVAACRKIVDTFLQDNPAKTADELYEHYTLFGQDPWIMRPASASDTPLFSAWDYARRRCNELRS